MLLKRAYEIPEGWAPERTAAGVLTNPLPIAGLEVIHTGVHVEQNFSRRLLDAGVAEGWASLSHGKITLQTASEDLVYTILRMPGLYCCHCDVALGEDASGSMGRDHVTGEHTDVVSPDAAHPAGYRRVNGYECVLDATQHAKWQRPAGATVSHWRG